MPATASQQGWLSKRSSGAKKRWQRRYFVLADGGLSYHDTPQQAAAAAVTARGRKWTAVAGARAGSAPGDPREFFVRPTPTPATTAAVRPMRLRASSVEEKQGWLACLAAAGAETVSGGAQGGSDHAGEGHAAGSAGGTKRQSPEKQASPERDAAIGHLLEEEKEEEEEEESHARAQSGGGGAVTAARIHASGGQSGGLTAVGRAGEGGVDAGPANTPARRRKGASHIDAEDTTVPLMLRRLSQVTWSTDTYNMAAPGAAKAAKREYERLQRLCRDRAASLGARAGGGIGAGYGCDGNGAVGGGRFGTLVAIPPLSIKPDIMERGVMLTPTPTVVASRMSIQLATSPKFVDSYGKRLDTRVCCRWWHGDVEYAPQSAHQLEAGLGRWSGAEEDPLSPSLRGGGRGPGVAELVDWSKWTTMLPPPPRSGAQKTGRGAGRRATIAAATVSAPEVAEAAASDAVEVRRELEGGFRLRGVVTDALDERWDPARDDGLDADGDDGEATGGANRHSAAGGGGSSDEGWAVDEWRKRPLLCRLNGEGNLESVPLHGVVHMLAAVQLGQDSWEARLLPLQDDGTVGCRCALTWRLQNDGKLYNIGAGRYLVLRARTCELELWLPDLMPTELLGQTPELLQSIYWNWDVPDERTAQNGLRATARVKLPKWYQPHRRVVCLPPLADIEAAAQELWDDPESETMNVRVSAVTAILEEREQETRGGGTGEQTLNFDRPQTLLRLCAQRLLKRIEGVHKEGRFAQAERLCRVAVEGLLRCDPKDDTLCWVGRTAEQQLRTALFAAAHATTMQRSCTLLRSALLSIADQRSERGSRIESDGEARHPRPRLLSDETETPQASKLLEEDLRAERQLEEAEATVATPLVLSRYKIDVWKYRVETEMATSSLPIYVSRRTGRPCLGTGVQMHVLEPKPSKGGKAVPWNLVRKVEVGPLPLKNQGANPMMLLWWMEEDPSGWTQLLEALEFLTCEDARGSAGSSTLSGAALDHSRSQLSDSSSFSFTVPPAVAGSNGSFHIRMRLGVNTGVIGSNWVFEANTSVANCTWLNPLTHCDGFFFTPKLKAPDLTNTAVPPPVVLDPDWERANILDVEQTEEIGLTAGCLRVYRISGLTPSCNASSAKFLGYGESKLELQMAPIRGEDGTGRVMSWEDANQDDSLWSESLVYNIPAEPFATIIMQKGIDRVRWRGPGALEEVMVGLATQNKAKNTKVLRDFVEALWDRQLEPLYNMRVQPWLQNKTLLRLLIDTRGSALREAARSAITGLGLEVPTALLPDRPSLLSFEARLDDGAMLAQWLREDHEDDDDMSTDESGGSEQDGLWRKRPGPAGESASAVTVIHITIPAGRSFSITAAAEHSRNPQQLTGDDTGGKFMPPGITSETWALGAQQSGPDIANRMTESAVHPVHPTHATLTKLQGSATHQQRIAKLLASKAASSPFITVGGEQPPLSPVSGLGERGKSSPRSTPAPTPASTDSLLKTKTINPHRATCASTILSAHFTKRRSRGWLGSWRPGSGAKRVLCQLIRKDRNAVLHGDLLIGGSINTKVDCKGVDSFVVNVGGSDAATYTFSPWIGSVASDSSTEDQSRMRQQITEQWVNQLSAAIQAGVPVILRSKDPAAEISPASRKATPRRGHKRDKSGELPVMDEDGTETEKQLFSGEMVRSSSHDRESYARTESRSRSMTIPPDSTDSSLQGLEDSLALEPRDGSAPRAGARSQIHPPQYRRQRRRLQMWWRILPSSGHNAGNADADTGQLNLHDTFLLDLRGGGFISKLPGGRIRVIDGLPPEELASASLEAHECAEAQHARLRFRGTHQGTRFPTLPPGATFTLQLTLIEEGAHEYTEIDVRVRVVEGDGSSLGEGANAKEHAATDARGVKPQRWPPLALGPSPSVAQLLSQVQHAMSQRLEYWRTELLGPRSEHARRSKGSGSMLPNAAILQALVGKWVRKEVLAGMATALPRDWRQSQPERIARWQKERLSGDLESFADGDISHGPPLTHVMGEVVKLRLVEWWHKAIQRYRAREQASAVQRQQLRQQRQRREIELLGPDDQADSNTLASVDMEVLRAADSLEVLTLVTRRTMRHEWRELLRDEIKPLLRKWLLLTLAGMAAFLLLAVFLAWFVTNLAAQSASSSSSSSVEHELQQLQALLEQLRAQVRDGSPGNDQSHRHDDDL